MEMILLTILTILNTLASVYCLTREYSEKGQKFAQIVIVWLVPFVGAVGFTVFHWLESHPKENPKEIGGGDNETDVAWNAHGSVNNGGLDD